MSFRPSMSQHRSVGDPLLSCDWYLLIPNIPGASDTRRMSYKVVSTALPGSQIEQVTMEIGAKKFNFAGRRVYSGSWTATLVETADASTRGDLLRWMDMARPYVSGAGTFRNVYGQTAELRVYDAMNNVAVSSVIHALFPITIDDTPLEQSSSIIQYSVTFSFDYADEVMGDLG